MSTFGDDLVKGTNRQSSNPGEKDDGHAIDLPPGQTLAAAVPAPAALPVPAPVPATAIHAFFDTDAFRRIS